MDVVLLRWPAERHRRKGLAAGGVPRLLLVEEGAAPPTPDGCLEDWIRVPVDDLDLQARLGALEARRCRHTAAAPKLDVHGVLRVGGAWVSLPPVEARLTSALLARMGAVVSRDTLARAGWPHGAPGRNALDVHVLRLRRRVATVGLAIRTVRSRGYLLEASATRQEGVQEA